MFEFEYPLLAILAFIPFIFRLFSALKKKSGVTQILHPNIANLQAAFSEGVNNRVSIKEIIIYLIWFCLVLALMHPQLVNKKVNIKNKGRNIMIAADLSGSMRALDFSTDSEYIVRLDVLKQTTASFIEKRTGDRIGLVLFGDHAYLHVPLTSDLKSVNEMLNNSMIGMAGESTAIGDAVGLAVKKLRDFSSDASTIILLTDGENMSGTLDPVRAAKISSQYNIKIYVIGIGKSGVAPVADDRGQIHKMQVRIDEKTLKNIAKITGGKYFNVTNKDIMAKIYDEINQLEKIENEAREFLIRKQLYRIPLGIAMLLLLTLVLIPLLPRK